MEVRLSPTTVREILGHDIGHSNAAGVGLRDDRKELRKRLRRAPDEVTEALREDTPALAQRVEGGIGKFRITPHKSGATTIHVDDSDS